MPERFQQEIEEILEQSEALAPPPRQRRPRAFRADGDSRTRAAFMPGRIIAVGVVALLAAALLVSTLGFDAVSWRILVGSALALAAVWYLFVLARADRAENRPHWRGQAVVYDTPQHGPSLWRRITRRFRR